MTFSKKIPFRRVAIGACVVVIIAFSACRLFNNLELIFYDLRFQLRPPLKVSDHIVIIEIDDTTLNNLGQWPLPRDFHADLVDVLSELGVKAIVFDILFSEPSDYDDLFAESIQDAKNVYLPLTFDIAEKGKINLLPFQDTPIQVDVTTQLKGHAYATGHINVDLDTDGKVRKTPLFIRSDDRMLPQLAAKAAFDWLGINAHNVEFKRNRMIVDQHLVLPTMGGNAFMINYPARWKDTSPSHHYSYFKILQSYGELKEGKTPSVDLSVFKDKICFIGLTATGTHDVGPIPLEKSYPLLGVHPSIFNSIITRQFIYDIGVFLNTVINLVVFVLSLFVSFRFSALKSLLGNVVFGLSYFIIAVIAFSLYSLWVDLFFPLLIISVTYVGAVSFRFLMEIRQRELLEKELQIAQSIQQGFLPQDVQQIPGVSVACFFRAARFVAGDLYDIFKLDDKKLGALIGDVAGKGVSASLLMAKTISLFRIIARQTQECGSVLSQLNKELYGRLGERFVTALYLIIDAEKKKVFASSAGQGPLLLYGYKEGKISEAQLSGSMPLGLMEDVSYKTVDFPIEDKDKIVIFSDGLPEARNKAGQEFGMDIVKDITLRHGKDSHQKVLNALQDSVLQFSGNSLYDDITVIVFSLNE